MAESKKADPKQILGSKLFFVTHFWPQFFFNPNFSLDTNLQLQLNWVIVNFSNTTQGVISTVSWKKGQNGPPPCQRMSDFCWPSSPLVSRCQHCSPPPPHIPKGGIKCFTQKSKYFLIMSKIRMIWTSSHNFLCLQCVHFCGLDVQRNCTSRKNIVPISRPLFLDLIPIFPVFQTPSPTCH